MTDYKNNNDNKRPSDTIDLNRSWEELLSGFKSANNEDVHSLADLGLEGDGLSVDDSEGDIEIRDLSDLNLLSPNIPDSKNSSPKKDNFSQQQPLNQTAVEKTSLNEQSQALSKESSENISEKNMGIDKMDKKTAKNIFEFFNNEG